MSDIFLANVPNRMWSEIAYVNFYVPVKCHPKVLALTIDYHFYELDQKQIIFDLDLSETILKGVILPRYSQNNDPTDHDSSFMSEQSDVESNDLQFGKYYSSTGSSKELYILIKAFDKLVAVQRTDAGFKFTKQFAQVDRFAIEDPENNYRSVLAIYFQNDSNPTYEDFVHTKTELQPSTSDAVLGCGMDESLSMITERVTQARAELAMLKIMTRRQFIANKDELLFGPDIVRSDRLEEKQILGKYGDVWMKICRDFLVIGIPVINNSNGRPTALKNVRPVLLSSTVSSLEYVYDVFQLKSDSYKFDSLNELFDSSCSEEKSELTFNKDWRPIKDKMLPPETSAVIVLKLKLNEVINTVTRSNQYHCFILYEIYNEILSTEFTQQNYVKTIEIDTKIICSPEYQITLNPATIYKDLLALSACSKLFVWTMDYKSNCVTDKLSSFFVDTFGFSRLDMGYSNMDERMDVDEDLDALSIPADYTNSTSKTPGQNAIFYHRPSSQNNLMGTLIRTESQSNRVLLKVYASEEYKALYIYSILNQEFDEECTIRSVNCDLDGCYQKTNLLNLYESLRKEVEIAIDNLHSASQDGNMKKRTELLESQMKMYAQELKTDCILLDINR